MAELTARLLRFRGATALLVLMLMVFSLGQRNFFNGTNLINIAVQASLLGLATCGALLPIITGRLDLSIGSVAALASVIFVQCLDYGLWVAGGLALLSGLGIGVLNGLLIGRFRLNSIVITLGAMAWAEGLALWISHGYPLAGTLDSFEMLGGGFFCYIPLPIVFFVATALGTHFLLQSTQFGHDLYAIGHGLDLALLCGIPSTRRLELAYAGSAVLAAFSGMVMASRLNTASPLVGQDTPLQALVAIVMGGNSLTGGYGGVANVIVGLLVVEVLGNGLNLWNISPSVRWGATGMILLIFSAIDQSRNRSPFGPAKSSE